MMGKKRKKMEATLKYVCRYTSHTHIDRYIHTERGRDSVRGSRRKLLGS